MNKQTHSGWKYLATLFKENFGVPNDVFAAMCTRAILLLCATGLSNESIALFIQADRKTVDDYVKEVFGFSGWEKDLDFNPLYYLETGRKLYTEQQSKVCKAYLDLFSESSKIESYYK